MIWNHCSLCDEESINARLGQTVLMSVGYQVKQLDPINSSQHGLYWP